MPELNRTTVWSFPCNLNKSHPAKFNHVRKLKVVCSENSADSSRTVQSCWNQTRQKKAAWIAGNEDESPSSVDGQQEEEEKEDTGASYHCLFPQLQPKEHGHNPGDDDWTIEGKHHHHDNITNKKNSNSIKHQEPRRPPNRKYEAVVTALKDDAVFVLQGRGWIENISSNTNNATQQHHQGWWRFTDTHSWLRNGTSLP